MKGTEIYMVKRLALCALALALAVGFCACVAPVVTEEELHGVWRTEDDGTGSYREYTFAEDGTCSYVVYQAGESYEGKEFKYTLDGSLLTFVDNEGVSTAFTTVFDGKVLILSEDSETDAVVEHKLTKVGEESK